MFAAAAESFCCRSVTEALPKCPGHLQVDLDLGNYERFLDISLTKKHNLTTGKIYQVLHNLHAVHACPCKLWR